MGQLTSPSTPPLFIVTGGRESGKTTFISQLYLAAVSENIDVAGVISPAVFVDNRKVGIDIKDPRSNLSRRLANVRLNEECGTCTDHWAFSDEAMLWGNELLAKTSSCDLLIVDELGPIELEHNGGWQNGIKALNEQKYKAALVVIRPELLDLAKTLWPAAEIIHIGSDQASDLGSIIHKIISLSK